MQKRPPLERFFSHVIKTDTCWLWQGATMRNGYGQFRPRDGDDRCWPAHRWLYEKTVGAVDNPLELDHLCRVRACVRPDHLEPVTRLENVRRGLRARANIIA